MKGRVFTNPRPASLRRNGLIPDVDAQLLRRFGRWLDDAFGAEPSGRAPFLSAHRTGHADGTSRRPTGDGSRMAQRTHALSTASSGAANGAYDAWLALWQRWMS
jgi:hypothetical protein